MITRVINLLEDCEIRAVQSENSRTITGYAAVFNKLSQDLGGFRERIVKGAFASSISRNDIRALWSHNIDIPLGRTGNKTLTLEEDDKGLKFTLDLPDTQAGRDAYESIKRGDVNGVSFGFNLVPDGREWQYQDDMTLVHVLKQVELYEISPTAFPAYPQTEVIARSGDGDQSKLQQEAQEFAKSQSENKVDFPFNRERLRLSLRRIGK